MALSYTYRYYLYSLPYITGSYGGDARYTLLIFAYTFAALYFITGTISAIRSRGLRNDEKQYNIYTPLLNGALLFFWILGVVPGVWQSLTLSAWMVVFAVSAYVVYRMTGERNTFYAYAAVGIVYLAAATAVELSGYALTIAYILEVGVLTALTRIALDDVKTAEGLSVLFAVPIFMSLDSVSSFSWSQGPINADFFVLIIMACVLSAIGVLIKSAYLVRGETNSRNGKTLIILGTIYAYVLIWLSLHAGTVLPSGLATGIALAVYTIVGIATYLYGQNNNSDDVRKYGSVLIGCVILRLLLVDVWQLELVWRIVVFALVGVLLMSTAFISKKKN